MHEPASRAILCQTTCLVTTVNDDAVPGAQRQYDSLLKSGCPSSHPLVEVGVTGRYRVLCQEKAALAARARARAAEAAAAGGAAAAGAGAQGEVIMRGGQEHSNEQL